MTDPEPTARDLLVGTEIGVPTVSHPVDEVTTIINLEALLACDLDCTPGTSVLKLCCVENGEEFTKEYSSPMCHNLGCASRGDTSSTEDASETSCTKSAGATFED